MKVLLEKKICFCASPSASPLALLSVGVNLIISKSIGEYDGSAIKD